MDKKLKQFLIKSVVFLALIHVGYFLYGFYKFKGIDQVNLFTEFYRFKFYDDVSISHFFITGLFLLIFLILLLKNHTKQKQTWTNLIKIGSILLLMTFLSFSFFISYSFGMYAQLRSELPQNKFHKDKRLLNVLNPFLYNTASYGSEELFDPVNILYPKPYPVMEVVDSTLLIDSYYQVEYTYYSIDTLKVLTKDFNQASTTASELLDQIGFDQSDLIARIIRKEVIKDSTQIIYKGREVSPRYDKDICIFIENNTLFSPEKDIPFEQQQYKSAVKRYQLLYDKKPDSLLSHFQKLDSLLIQYGVESHIVPKDLVEDVYYYRDSQGIPTTIRNQFDRKALAEKFTTLDRLFYQPNFLHPSITSLFFGLVLGIWLIGFTIFMTVNYTRNKR